MNRKFNQRICYCGGIFVLDGQCSHPLWNSHPRPYCCDFRVLFIRKWSSIYVAQRDVQQYTYSPILSKRLACRLYSRHTFCIISTILIYLGQVKPIKCIKVLEIPLKLNVRPIFCTAFSLGETLFSCPISCMNVCWPCAQQSTIDQ